MAPPNLARALAALSALGGAAAAPYYPSDPAGIPHDFVCAWRTFAAEYAAALRPDAAALAFDALQLAVLCNATVLPAPTPRAPRAATATAVAATSVFVDAVHGSDSAAGTLAAPLRTLPAAVARSRGLQHPTSIFARAGTYHLSATLELGAADSELTIAAYNGEPVWVSGAVPLGPLVWEAVTAPVSNVWRAAVPKASLATAGGVMRELRVDGARAWRAREPNANPERDLFPAGWITTGGTKWAPPKPTGPITPVSVFNGAIAKRNSTENVNYTGALGGPCVNFDPPFSYWCALNPAGGGGFQYYVPGGAKLHAGDIPPFATSPENPAVFQVWRQAHWANWMFEIESYDNVTNEAIYAKGGFQGARGGPGSEYFVENALAFLDAPGEYYYDTATESL
jgi:hypothetical protein